LLIIFDLDDTLIDTSGCLTPVKLEDALHRMIEAGLHIEDVPASLEMIKRLDAGALSSRHALSEFLELHDGNSHLFGIGEKEIYHNLSPDLNVHPLDGAIEILSELSKVHYLALVTIGVHDIQMGKMKKAGIDTALFSKIVVSDSRNKKPHYQSIMDQIGVGPKEIVVCGDRIGLDLTPGKELGFKTIHMQWGRGKGVTGSEADVDYKISHLAEIREIISHKMSFNGQMK
jgi:FMN phosphatase YigB (HAD superfamily)